MPTTHDIQRLKELNSYDLRGKYWIYKSFLNDYVISRFGKYNKSKLVDVYKVNFFVYADKEFQYFYDVTEIIPELKVIQSPVYIIVKRNLSKRNKDVYNESVEAVKFIFKEDFENNPDLYMDVNTFLEY